MPVSGSSPTLHRRARRAPRRFLERSLRGSGQVMFMNNPYTGLLNFVALGWGAWAGGTTWTVVLGAALGVLVATGAAQALRVERAARDAGLYGFNGLLVGAGIPTFLAPTPLMWAVLVFACAVSAGVTRALAELLRPWQVPGLTFPFVLTTWLVLLAADPLPGLATAALPQAGLAAPAVAASVAFGLADWVRAVLASVAQVFFVDDAVSGALFLLALALQSRRAAVLGAAGALLAVAAALALGAERAPVVHGLWGYSAVLTAVAVGGVFLPPGGRTLALCAIATLFTVLVQGATLTLAGTLGVPALTFPFVLATWLVLLARGRSESA